MQCVFSPSAELDLEEIADYIAQDSPRRAMSFIQELREHCEKIINFPEKTRERPEIAEGIRLVPFGRYVICYTIGYEEIRIERIVQGGRNLPHLFVM
jgi:toxin ParE1/3/4